MELPQAISLIARGIEPTQSSWADLGSGDGLFTQALGTLIGPDSTIYTVDTNKRALNKIPAIPGITLHKLIANFEKDELGLKNLDGILMANSLHFIKDKDSFIKKASTWLKPSGCFIIVEYDTDTANAWVPWPVSFGSLGIVVGGMGYESERIGETSSIYNRSGIYAVRIQK